MTKEDKDLILKDLCGRLPYRVKCQYYDICIGEYVDGIIEGFEREKYFHVDGICVEPVMDELKPYLFPLSSMTEEQKLYLEWHTKYRLDDGELVVKRDDDDEYLNTNIYDYLSLIEWLNKNHFDYQGLIEKGLAIDATELNIY